MRVILTVRVQRAACQTYQPHGDKSLSKALEFEVVGSSELIRIECKRVLLRYRLEGLIRDAQIRDAILLSLISERRDLGTWRTAP